MAQKIENIDELKALCNDEQSHDCYIVIAGIIRSSSSIFMNEDGTFSVTNQKDGSEDLFTEVLSSCHSIYLSAYRVDQALPHLLV